MTTGQDLIEQVGAILKGGGIPDPLVEATHIVDTAGRQVGTGELRVRALDMASARAMGTPLAYLTGCASFMGIDLFTAPGALIPREETELLGRTALQILQDLSAQISPRLIDMCCGSGNLACGLAVHEPRTRVWAADLTDGAVGVARANVERLGVADRVTVSQGDLFASLAGLGLEGTIDVIVCNPPYISSGKLEKDRAELLSHEPREAFDGGPYGVSIFQRVVRDSPRFLKAGGRLLFEIGLGQERQVTAIVSRANSYEPVELVNDSAAQPRVVICRTKAE